MSSLGIFVSVDRHGSRTFLVPNDHMQVCARIGSWLLNPSHQVPQLCAEIGRAV